MATLKERNFQVLKIIVEEYIASWNLVWSKSLLKKHNLWVSPATIRLDMNKLEKAWLIFQPYNSSWRKPTAKWLRVFIAYMMEKKSDYFIAPNQINSFSSFKKFEDRLYTIVYNLSKATKTLSFLSFPNRWILKYCWFSSLSEDFSKATIDIIKMVEEKDHFIEFTKTISKKDLDIYIWEEDILSYLKDYTIIIRKINIEWEEGYIWIIWWLRMDYSFNISALRWII